MRTFARVLAVLVVVASHRPEMGAQSRLDVAADATSPSESPAKGVSLYVSLREKKSGSLEKLRADDLSVRDGETVLETQDIQLAKDQGTPLITLVFDDLEPADRRRAVSAARKLVKGLAEGTFPVSVWQAERSLRVLQTYTTDKGRIDAALRLVAEGKAPALEDAAATQERQLTEQLAQVGAGPDEDAGAVLLRTLARTGEIGRGQHLPAGIAALMAGAEEQGAVRGRKAMVYFTAAEPSGVNANRVLRSLYERMSNASVSLYIVDLRGLDRSADQAMLATLAVGAQTASFRQQIADAPKPLPGTSPSAATPKTLNLPPAEFARMNDTISQIESGDLGRGTQNALGAVAAGTGGGYADADGDAAKLGRTLVADLSHGYKLTFPAGAPAGGSGFHKVELRIAERGVTVASSLGYLDKRNGAGAEDGASVSLEARAAKADADWAELTRVAASDDLKLRAGIRPGSAAQYELAVQVPIDQMELRRDSTTRLFSLHVTVGAELDDGTGRPVARFLEEFDRRGALDNEAKVRDTVLTMSRVFEVPPGTYTLHARTRDWLGEKTGQLTKAVTVRAKEGVELTAAHPALATASVSRALESDPSVEAALSRAEMAAVERGLSRAPDAVTPPEGTEALIEAARATALRYAETLPNFLCVERIDRSTDPRGTGDWKHHEALVEMLRYQDRTESRTMLEVNGEKSRLSADRVEGARSNGEFGGILHTVFAPEARATFQWERAMEQGNDTLEVYRFAIPQAHSEFFVTDHSGSRERAGLHGLVYVNAGTQAVWRVLAQTDALPAGFGVRASWMSVIYDYVGINGHEYLLPMNGEVGLQQRKQEMTLLQLRFSDYRRFGSRSRIIYSASQRQP